MTCKKSKGFTLVELLVTIILLGIIGAIIIYNMSGVTTSSKEIEYERFVAAVKSSASVYADVNSEAFNDLYINKSYIYITAEELIKNGYIDEKIKNPYTGKIIGANEQIKASLDNNTGGVVFEYPITNKATETFMVALTDYVVWGEPYDCMQGVGSYELALSEEDGTLIMLDDPAVREKYNFECSMPNSFSDYEGKTGYKYTEEAGNYEITYSWITSSGTRKTATRTLKVLPKVKPSFKTNYEYNFKEENTDIWYTPTYDAKDKTWKYLTYTPYIEGADPETTIFKIQKKAEDPKGHEPVCVTENCEYISEYKEYIVDDGDKTYTIETIIKGHHFKDYSYTAKGKANIKSKLVIPSELIFGSGIDSKNETWATEREFSIYDTWSPVGVEHYEFLLSNDANLKSEQVTEGNGSFKKDPTLTAIDPATQLIKVIYDGKCKNEALNYKYVYFRAVNKDGFVGDWSPYTNAYLTNQIEKLIKGDSVGCSNSKNCCLKTGSGCYYSNKVKYLKYGGKTFVILEYINDSDKDTSTYDPRLIIAYNGVSNERVTPTAVHHGYWEVKTCDGIFSTNYKYYSPVLQNIIDGGQLFLKSLPENYNKRFEVHKWPAGYSAFVGNVDKAMVEKYGKALYDTKPYWTTTTYVSNFVIYVTRPYAHGNHTTKSSTYFYSVEGNDISKKYAGSNAYVKPILKMQPSYICSGNGTSTSPYIIAE